jgi:Peptidase family M48
VTLRNPWFAGLLISLSTLGAQAKKPHIMPMTPLTPAQATLIDKAMANEQGMVKELQKRIPMVQTYIQNLKPDAQLAAVPSSDKYILSRVDFEKSFQADGYREKSKGLLRGSVGALSLLSKALGLPTEYLPTGFMDMMFIDPSDFNRQRYDFGFVRNDFLGSVHTQVFDVLPKNKTSSGRFTGRIWVDDQEGAVVRFNGIFSGNAHIDRPRYFHFDSWRVNLQPGVWLPAEIYVEESHSEKLDDEPDLRARTSFWGYSLKLPTHNAENTAIQIDNVTDNSDATQDVSPLEASRAWVEQAEANVLDRLVQAGVLAPPSDFDKVLETVTNNLIIGNNLVMPDAVHCRVLLTTPLESLAVGNTILLSRGLIDVLPSEEGLAAVLAFQLAHITLGHHVDTRYAFNDRLLFPDEVTFQRITMNHSQSDDRVAAKKAIEFLNKSVYHDHLSNAGLFLAQLQDRSKELRALTTPRIGDSLLDADGIPWLVDLTKASLKLDMDNLDQVAALPLGSHLKVDAWDDKVLQLKVKPVPLLNARDKMPFEITPVLFRLTRYRDPASAITSASSEGH